MLRRMTSSILQQRSNYLRNKQRLMLGSASTAIGRSSKPFSSTSSKRDEGGGDGAVALKPWGQPFVTCNGDYREEAWLERHVGGPLYSGQMDLPRLPVCDVRETLDRFLPTAVPLSQSDDEARNLLKAVEDFESQAEPMQRRLVERAQEYHDSSWLQHWCVYVYIILCNYADLDRSMRNAVMRRKLGATGHLILGEGQNCFLSHRQKLGFLSFYLFPILSLLSSVNLGGTLWDTCRLGIPSWSTSRTFSTSPATQVRGRRSSGPRRCCTQRDTSETRSSAASAPPTPSGGTRRHCAARRLSTCSTRAESLSLSRIP